MLTGARVSITALDTGGKEAAIPSATTGPQGQARFESLAPGRYALSAEFPGFQSRTLPQVRIRGGENRQVLILPIDRLQSSVTVERDRQQAAADRDVTFGTVLTREQIDALSDDPEELRRQLMDIGGPGATIVVQAGVYFKDDIKIRKSFTVTGGVRYEAQTHVPDAVNFAPRAGFTWAPFRSGRTTLRGS